MKKIVFFTLAALLLLGVNLSANAQCQTVIPQGQDFLVGDSWCMEFCIQPPMPFVIGSFFLVGLPGTGELEIPILLFGNGCSPANTLCEEDCNQIIAPTGDWILGGHPSSFYDDWYYMGNACLDIMIRHAHDNLWDIIIVSRCNGCFCFTFEDQLPVELLDFTASAGDGQVMLNWRTASESNTDHFEIVRGGEKFAEIAASNTPTGAVYSWTDISVANGNVYNYGLYSVAVSGARELLGVVEASPSFTSGTVTEYALHQNYPNPFNPETKITFDLVESGFVSLKVVNLLGQEVAVIASGDFSAGRHVVSFDGSNLTSGVYLYTMSAGDFSATKKLVLLK